MTKAIRNAGASLRSSVVLVFCIPGLTIGDAITELGSQLSGIKRIQNSRGCWQCFTVRSQVGTIIVMGSKVKWHPRRPPDPQVIVEIVNRAQCP